MFTQPDLDRLIHAMRAHGVTLLSVDTDDDALTLELAAAPSANTAAPVPAPVKQVPAKSPCIGRFMTRGTDDGLTELDTTSPITSGDTLGYIVRGQTRAVVGAPIDGVLASDVPDAGTLFGFGDVVFTMKATA